MDDNKPFAQYHLQRLPLRRNETLRAWDAADELLIQHLKQSSAIEPSNSILLVNDQFGALTCSLNQHPLTSWGDSYIGHLATELNLHSNQLQPNYKTLASTHAPRGTFHYVLIKIPKSLALLEQQLILLRPCVDASTTIIAAGMIKYLHKSHIQLLERYLGTTTTSLAVKKARLAFSRVNQPIDSTAPPYPSNYDLAELDLRLSEHANVFCRGKLDIGSRFMIEQFKHLPRAKKILDLGCGNGILGIMAKRQMDQQFQLDSLITFVDESYMAVSSAETNYRRAFKIADNVALDKQFLLSNCLSQVSTKNIDLILCNPPFHQNNVVGGHIAELMFKQSKSTLVLGGQLWVVANRHLGYFDKLKRIYGNCKTIASNKKFIVLAASLR